MKLPDSAVQLRSSAPQEASAAPFPKAHPPAIELEIERLTLEGFDLTRREQTQLQAGMTAELKRLLQENGFASPLVEAGTMISLPDGKFSYRRGQKPAELGRQIARAVYERIGR